LSRGAQKVSAIRCNQHGRASAGSALPNSAFGSIGSDRLPSAEGSRGRSQGEATPEPTSPVSGLAQQIADQRRYAEYQALQQYVASNFPGALPHEAQWLMVNPHHLGNPALIHAAAQIAAQRGIPRNDPQFLQFVGQLLDQHYAAQTQAAPAPPPISPPPAPPPVAHVDIEQSDHGAEPEEPIPSHHVSAPVSHGDSGHSVEPEPTQSSIRLTAEQRDIAQRSGISDVEYAKQLLRMQKMQKSGLIK
jgi:hypothetical protein